MRCRGQTFISTCWFSCWFFFSCSFSTARGWVCVSACYFYHKISLFLSENSTLDAISTQLSFMTFIICDRYCFGHFELSVYLNGSSLERRMSELSYPFGKTVLHITLLLLLLCHPANYLHTFETYTKQTFENDRFVRTTLFSWILQFNNHRSFELEKNRIANLWIETTGGIAFCTS